MQLKILNLQIQKLRKIYGKMRPPKCLSVASPKNRLKKSTFSDFLCRFSDSPYQINY